MDPDVTAVADELLLELADEPEESDELDELELPLDEELDNEVVPELRLAAVLTEGISTLVRPRKPPRILGALTAA